MIFRMLSNVMIALLELCCAINKPDKVSTITQDMKGLAQEETNKIVSYHSRCKCYKRTSKRSVVT